MLKPNQVCSNRANNESEQKSDTNDDVTTRNGTNEYLYFPDTQYMARNFITIPRELTDVVIPKRVRQRIQNIFEFMNKSTAMVDYCHNKVYFNNKESIIYNFDFRDKYSGETLYCIADRIQNGRRYLMRHQLYTQYDIAQITPHSLSVPGSCRPLYRKVLQNMETVQNKLASSISHILSNTKWNRVRIHNATLIPDKHRKKQFNTQRLKLSVAKTDFISTICAVPATKMHLIPIIMFNENKREYRVEYVQIIKIRNVDIAISYDKDTCNNIKVSGIHLNKDCILMQHQLVSLPDHDCHCLDAFESTIDDLHIGNPDVDLNRFKDLKKRSGETIEELTSEIDRLKAQVQQLQQSKRMVVAHGVPQYSVTHYYVLPVLQNIVSNVPPIHIPVPQQSVRSLPASIQIPRVYNNNNGNTPLSVLLTNSPQTAVPTVSNVSYDIRTAAATPTPNAIDASNAFPDTYWPPCNNAGSDVVNENNDSDDDGVAGNHAND